jgi:hypothetical protein
MVSTYIQQISMQRLLLMAGLESLFLIGSRSAVTDTHNSAIATPSLLAYRIVRSNYYAVLRT